MVIGIDGNEANEQNKVGVHQFAFKMLWGLHKSVTADGGINKIVVFLKNTPRMDMPPENKYYKYRIIKGKSLWILFSLTPKLIGNKEIDVFFAPNHYLPPLTNIPMVCTIHDLGYLKFSGQFRKLDFWQLKYWSATSIKISKYIISVSEFTEKDIVRHYPSAVNKIKVIYNGVDHDIYNNKILDSDVRRVLKKYNITGNYILFLGTLKPSKNIEGIIKAYKKLLSDKKYRNISLVIAGKKGWFFKSIFDLVSELKLKDKVIFTEYVKEEDKKYLYKGAIAFLSPSYWEGFGINVLEAMSCGTPVVVSKCASLPEVAGNEGIYVDENDPGDIKRGIKLLLDMGKNEYAQIQDRSYKRSLKFSWDKSARKLYNLLISVKS